MKRITANIILLFLLVAGSFYSYAQPKPVENKEVTTRILFLLDGSGSMLNNWANSNRMAIAKSILTEIVDSLRQHENIEMALRVYGHQSPRAWKDCKDTRLEVGFGKNTAPLIKSKLNQVRPKGTTPIAYSLEQAAYDFPKDAGGRNIVILITDGIESCEGDPCAISLAFQKKNVFLKPFIIGLGLSEEVTEAFDCMGAFYNAQSPDAFKSIMRTVVSRVVNYTTAQVNLMDVHNKPTETDVNMTFYDNFSGVVRHNFYHTFNYRGKPDTISLDPVNIYDIMVHTIPPVEKKKVEIYPNHHNVINIDAPQGYLNIKLQSATVFGNINEKLKCLIRKPGDPQTIHVQQIGTTEKYLVGRYDLVFLTLPRITMQNVDVGQSRTTTIQIPPPGLVTIMKNYAGIGSVFIEKEGKLEKIYQLNEKALKETVALQPGKYRIIFRPKFRKEAQATVVKIFTIESGGSVSIKL